MSMSEVTDVSKPFECTSPGCKATFTNEDHLSSHQKRHEMSLLLPGGVTLSRFNSLGADLTPTPTRFIRMGDEVGLFQDLIKANPFDEQFRKAAEQNKTASAILPLPSTGTSEDTLNTPHIVHPAEGDHPAPQPRPASPPHSLGSPPPAHVSLAVSSPPPGRAGAPPAHGHMLLDSNPASGIDHGVKVEGPLDMRSPSVLPATASDAAAMLSAGCQLPVPGGSGALEPHSPGHPVRPPLPGHPVPTTLQSSAVSSTVATPRLQRPPASLPPEAVQFQIKLSDGHVIPLAVRSEQAASGSVRERLKHSLRRAAEVCPQPPPAAAVRSAPLPSRPHQTEDSLRKERNRAAANRWRARKKRAQQQMATSMETLTRSVAELRRENAELRTQVAGLRQLLAQHRHCDVTRALRAPLVPPVIVLQPPAATHQPQLAETAVSRSSAQASPTRLANV